MTLSTDVQEAREGDLVVYSYLMWSAIFGSHPLHVWMKGTYPGDELTHVSDNSSTLPGHYDPQRNYWRLVQGFQGPYILEVMVKINTGTAGTIIEQNASLTSSNDWGHDVNISNNFASHQLSVLAIELEVGTNGVDADLPSGPVIPVGESVQWTYEVTNVSSETLSSVAVTDDKGVAVSCSHSTLAAGESMLCTASGTAVEGQYANVGMASGVLPGGAPVSHSDPSHYLGLDAGISIETKTNGFDADDPPGPLMAFGDPVTWTYEVVNTGAETLTDLAVTDDHGVSVSCPTSSLLGGESMTCSASGVSTLGQYSNLGSVSGQPPVGGPMDDTDPSHYLSPSIVVEATKTDLLQTDLDGDGTADPGDLLRYEIVVSNPEDAEGFAAVGLRLYDLPDAATILEDGSVTTSQGTVASGNGTGDRVVEVDFGDLGDGESATVVFSARVEPDLPYTVDSIVNQGSVEGANVLTTLTDDLDGEGPTVTLIGSGSVMEIPTASDFGLAILFLSLLGAGLLTLRRMHQGRAGEAPGGDPDC